MTGCRLLDKPGQALLNTGARLRGEEGGPGQKPDDEVGGPR